MGFDDLGFLSPVVARKQSLALSVQSPAQQNYEFDPFAHLNQQHPLLLSSPLSHSLPIHSHSHMQSHLHSQPHLVANQANQPNFSFNPSQRRMSHQIMSRPLDQYDIDFLCRPPMSRHPSLPQVSFLQQQHNPISTPQSPIHHQNNTINQQFLQFQWKLLQQRRREGSIVVELLLIHPVLQLFHPNPSQPPHAILKSSPPPKLQIDLTQQPRPTSATVTLQNTVGNAGAGSSSSISPDPESPPHQHHVKHEDSDWTPTTSGMTPATPTSTSVTTPTTAKRMARYKSASAPNLGTVPGSDNRPRDFICATCHNRFLRRQDLNRHEVTHNRTKQFTCPLGCGTNFGRSDALTRHLKMKKCSGAN
ncbi:hypothetical protein BDR26DRAFT_209175 [Obelidium mucronatum]|nr:hypothetical protein BDR26DRAFT_209175 [Obelidium mucronatum]